MSDGRRGQTIWGAIFVALGGVLLLDRFGVIASASSYLVPVVVIAVGVVLIAGAFSPSTGRRGRSEDASE